MIKQGLLLGLGASGSCVGQWVLLGHPLLEATRPLALSTVTQLWPGAVTVSASSGSRMIYWPSPRDVK